MLRITLLIIFTMSLGHSEDTVLAIDLTKIELPARVVSAYDAMNDDIAKAEAEYLAAVEKAKSSALKTIEREQKRNKDALVGLAIDELVKRIEVVGAKDMLGQPIVDKDQTVDVISSIQGKWNRVEANNVTGSIWEIKGNQMISARGSVGEISIQKDDPKTCLVKWNHGHIYTFTLQDDGSFSVKGINTIATGSLIKLP